MKYSTDNIGPNIRRLRKAKRMRQSDLAEKAFVCPLAISQWELGKAVPQTGNFVFLCQALGCTPNDLFGREEEK